MFVRKWHSDECAWLLSKGLFAEGDGNAGGGTGGGDGGTTVPGGQGGSTPPPADRTLLGGGTDPGADGADDKGGEGAVAWRDDWRETMAGDDAAFLRTLKRYTTPENFAKGFREQQKKLSAGQTAGGLPEDATPEEVAAYRKAAGIPDKPDGYGFAFPEALAPTEADTEALTAFQEHMHAANVAPGAAKAAFDFYVKNMEAGRAAMAEMAEKATLDNLAELRGEFKGREFARNTKIADEFLLKHFGNDQASLDALNEILATRLESGVQVMNYAPFMRGLFAMARAYADDESLIGGDAGGGGKSIDEEKDELVKKSAKQRLTPAEDKRLDELIAAQLRRDERSSRAA